MSHKHPLVIITLDTRSYGPAYCPVCGTDVEEVGLTRDVEVVCPDCLTPVPGFEDFGEPFVTARLAPGRSRR